ncbi:MAG TPA: AMP-binding protein [Streptosporangiaceae bacterium]|nr:AMP-binding protein [Streptosporangiaceae bacterium]
MLSLIHVVQWRAAVTGDQVALSDHQGGELTYSALAEVEQSAVRYAAAGICPGDVVPIVARNQVGWVTALLGLIRLGALPAAVNWRLAPPEVSALLALMRQVS